MEATRAMGGPKRYSQAELEALVDVFQSPMLVVFRGRVLHVNAAYCRVFSRTPEQMAGRPYVELLPAEERSRLSARFEAFQRGELDASESRIYSSLARGGEPQEFALQVQDVPVTFGGAGAGAEPDRATLVHVVVLGARPASLGLAERLVEMSAALVRAQTERDVRQAVVEGLGGVGYRARFLALEPGALAPPPGGAPARLHAHDGADGPPDADGPLALEALREGRPVLGGHAGPAATHVYLPVAGPGPGLEVLRVEGPGLTPLVSPVLMLFAKVVGAALSDVRRLVDLERRQADIAAVADTARFVAQPVPPSPEDFLARVAGPLEARAVALYVPQGRGGELVLAAHHGLPEEERPLAARVPLGEGLVGRCAGGAAASAGGLLSSPEDEAQLVHDSGGGLGCAAAVPLTRGGQVRGVLVALRAPGQQLQHADLRLMSTLADLLVALLEQRRLRSESARQLSDTRLLLDLARTTAGTLDTAGILDVAADFLVRLLDVTNCFIYTYDERARLLRASAASSAIREAFRGTVIPVDGASLAATVSRERRAAQLPDLGAPEAQGRFHAPSVQRYGCRALLALPLLSREELIGVVVVDDTRGPRTFGPATVELAEATCGQLALSVANARLYESLWASYAELAATRAEMVKRERLAALGELSAIVAHEVRNPLGVIFNAVASLRRLVQPQGDAGMLLDILAEESDRLNRMVGDLLDYTRPRDPVLLPEDIGRVLQDSLEAAAAQHAGVQRVELVQDVEPGLPPVPMDRRLIRQALVNVAVNAIQSMPAGGRVEVRARREARIGGGGMLRIDIRDQGPGIPAEVVHRVFEPFFTTKAQGTGLGLAVVKRILDEHRGEVGVESAPGRGTTFIFRLPLEAPEAPAAGT